MDAHIINISFIDHAHRHRHRQQIKDGIVNPRGDVSKKTTAPLLNHDIYIVVLLLTN